MTSHADQFIPEPKRFDVFIVGIKSGKIERRIGCNLPERHAERIERAGISKTDLEQWYVATERAGKYNRIKSK